MDVQWAICFIVLVWQEVTWSTIQNFLVKRQVTQYPELLCEVWAAEVLKMRSCKMMTGGNGSCMEEGQDNSGGGGGDGDGDDDDDDEDDDDDDDDAESKPVHVSMSLRQCEHSCMLAT
jgi:hypothetical protein